VRGIVNLSGAPSRGNVKVAFTCTPWPEIGVASTKRSRPRSPRCSCSASFGAPCRSGTRCRSRSRDPDAQASGSCRCALTLEPQVRALARSFPTPKISSTLAAGEFPGGPRMGALKLKEISYIHAEGYPAAEMKHGPIALIDEHMPVVFVAPEGHVYQKVLSNMQEVKAAVGGSSRSPATGTRPPWVGRLPAARARAATSSSTHRHGGPAPAPCLSRRCPPWVLRGPARETSPRA